MASSNVLASSPQAVVAPGGGNPRAQRWIFLLSLSVLVSVLLAGELSSLPAAVRWALQGKRWWLNAPCASPVLLFSCIYCHSNKHSLFHRLSLWHWSSKVRLMWRVPWSREQHEPFISLSRDRGRALPSGWLLTQTGILLISVGVLTNLKASEGFWGCKITKQANFRNIKALTVFQNSFGT